MQEFIIVYVTTGSAAESEQIARALVEERLAACVNRTAPIQSVYRWQGKVEQSQEELLIIKSRRELYPALERRVRALHSYAVPEILALPVLEGSAEYLRWLREQVSVEAKSDDADIRTVMETSAGGVIYRRNGE
ncbi:MAG TPA: divalent-cation tolerance protein CutA, partial [Candidatus Binatia bacterium]